MRGEAFGIAAAGACIALCAIYAIDTSHDRTHPGKQGRMRHPGPTRQKYWGGEAREVEWRLLSTQPLPCRAWAIRLTEARPEVKIMRRKRDGSSFQKRVR